VQAPSRRCPKHLKKKIRGQIPGLGSADRKGLASANVQKKRGETREKMKAYGGEGQEPGILGDYQMGGGGGGPKKEWGGMLEKTGQANAEALVLKRSF